MLATLEQIHSRAGGAIGLALLGTVLLAASPAPAQAEFEQCVSRLEALAVERGIDAATAGRVLADVSPLERVIRADRSQPEFVQGFADYLNLRVTPERVAAGRAAYLEYRNFLRELTASSGVPGQYLVAFWGLESNYGRTLGNIPVFDSLTTLACDARRSGMFTAEVIDALRIVERGDAVPEQMVGSWAGAMGQTQFLPSAYLLHAVDGDRDGRADLWSSAEDALASAARYLASLGWVRQYRWGREVVFPEGFDYALTGPEHSRPLSEWRALGVRDVGGNLLPELDIDTGIVVPAGSMGPAFAVYENFEVIMRWNRSEFFALAVGHLADRIAGGAELAVPPPNTAPLSRDRLRSVQQALVDLGYEPGPADGILGAATRAALRRFQLANGLVPDGYPAPGVVARLLPDGP